MFAPKANYAHLATRIFANVVDNILIFLMTFFVMVILTFSFFDNFTLPSFLGLFQVDLTSPLPLSDHEMDKGLVFFVIYMVIAYAFVSLIYFQIMLAGKRQATYGMQLFGIKLTDQDGEKLSFDRVFGRNVLFILFKYIYVGLASAITIPHLKRHQGLHDLPFGAVIVETGEKK